MFVTSRLSSRTDLRKFRFRLVVLPVKRWLAKALWYLIFPLPVTLNLLEAPRFVFNLSMLYYPFCEKTLISLVSLFQGKRVTQKRSLFPGAGEKYFLWAAKKET
jgi:hypothetical protein